MSFAKGFAKGLANAYTDEVSRNRDENALKRDYYRKLMFETALPAYYQKKQKAQTYRTLQQELKNQYPNASDGQLASIVNRVGGDGAKAYELAAKADFDVRRKEIDKQVESMRPTSPEASQGIMTGDQQMREMGTLPQSSQNTPQLPQGAAGMTTPTQPQSGSVSFSERPTRTPEREGGFNIFGKRSDEAIRSEVAQGIAADLGLDEDSFSGMMQAAFTGYQGLEGGEYVHFERGLDKNQRSTFDTLMGRFESGDHGMSDEQEKAFLTAATEGDVNRMIELGDFLTAEEKEAMKARYGDSGSGSGRKIKYSDIRDWQGEAASMVKNRFGTTGVDGQFTFAEDVDEQDLARAQAEAQDHVMMQLEQNPNQPPSMRMAVAYGLGTVSARDAQIKWQTGEDVKGGLLVDGTVYESKEDFYRNEVERQRDPLVQRFAEQSLFGGQNQNQEQATEDQKDDVQSSDEKDTAEIQSQELPTVSTQEEFDDLEEGARYYEKDENGNIVTDENGQPEVFIKQ